MVVSHTGTAATGAIYVPNSIFFLWRIFLTAPLGVVHCGFEVVSPRRLGGLEATGEPCPGGEGEPRDSVV